MIGEYSCPYLHINGRLVVGLACDSKGATFIGNLRYAFCVVNVVSPLARVLGGVHYMLRAIM